MISIQDYFDCEDEWFESDVYGVVFKVIGEGSRWFVCTSVASKKRLAATP